VSSHAHGRTSTDGRVPSLKPHNVGLQIPRRLHPEVSNKDAVPGASPAPRRGVPQAGRAEGVEDRGRALDARSRAHVDLDPTEVCGVAGGRVHQGQERDPSRPCLRGEEAQTSSGSISGPEGTSSTPWGEMRRRYGPTSATRRRGWISSTCGGDPPLGGTKSLGPRQRPHLPPWAVPVLSPRLCRGMLTARTSRPSSPGSLPGV